MLADYSSYIEFLAAIYTSMFVDINVLTEFWIPENYYKNLESSLRNFSMNGDDKLRSQILESSKQYSKERNNCIKRRAVFMFSMTAFTLIFIGYESELFDTLSSNSNLYIAYLITTILVYIIVLLVFSKKIFSKWKYTIMSCIITFVLFLVLFFYPIDIAENISSYHHKYFTTFALVALSFPIIFQIFENWIFSSAYSGYLKSQLLSENEDYNNAIECLKIGNSNLPRRYRKLIEESAFSSDKNKTLNDICLQGAITIHQDNLSSFCRRPILLKILLSWFLHKLKLTYFFLKRRWNNTPTKSSITLSQSSVVTLDFKKEYDQYLFEKANNKNKLPLKVFCKNHNYDYTAMIAWLKKINQK